ncbi:MAG: hypothetical protein KDB07_13350 [Planctomycetes bacterium]|nr:hypothetical protein [Planctomycetota bacterium]
MGEKTMIQNAVKEAEKNSVATFVKEYGEKAGLVALLLWFMMTFLDQQKGLNSNLETLINEYRAYRVEREHTRQSMDRAREAFERGHRNG